MLYAVILCSEVRYFCLKLKISEIDGPKGELYRYIGAVLGYFSDLFRHPLEAWVTAACKMIKKYLTVLWKRQNVYVCEEWIKQRPPAGTLGNPNRNFQFSTFFTAILCSVDQKERGQLAVYYPSPQSCILTFSYLFA